MIRKFTMILLFACLGFLASCQRETVLITFETNGGDMIEPIEVPSGSLIDLPHVNKIGSNFVGWFTDDNLKNPFDPEVPVRKNMTLFVAWTKSIERFVEDINRATEYRLEIDQKDIDITVLAKEDEIYITSIDRFYDEDEIYVDIRSNTHILYAKSEPITCFGKIYINNSELAQVKRTYEEILDIYLVESFDLSWFDKEGETYTLKDDKYWIAGIHDIDLYQIIVNEETFSIHIYDNKSDIDTTITFSQIGDVHIEPVDLTMCDTIPVQGVTNTKIVVGNIASYSEYSGALTEDSRSLNAGIQAYFNRINDSGGIGGRIIEFKHRNNDLGDLEAMVDLVQSDRVFAVIGHMESFRYIKTLDYLEQYGVPVIGSTHTLGHLSYEGTVGNNILPIIPNDVTEGKALVRRVIESPLFGENEDEILASTDKIGVLYITSDMALGLMEGIKQETEKLGVSNQFIEQYYSSYDQNSLNQAIQILINRKVKAVIVVTENNQVTTIIDSLKSMGLHVPTFTPSKLIDMTLLETIIDYPFSVYVNVFIDNDETFINQFEGDMKAMGFEAFIYNRNAIYGYLFAMTFVEGLNRVGTEELTWESYIAALESAPIDLPIIGTVDFGQGDRFGSTIFALYRYDAETQDLIEVLTYDDVLD